MKGYLHGSMTMKIRFVVSCYPPAWCHITIHYCDFASIIHAVYTGDNDNKFMKTDKA